MLKGKRRRVSARKPARKAADSETERRILDAARAVFIRRGTAGARMQEIAAEAGVNQALLHYYYRSKERLAAAVFQQAASRLFPAVMAILGSDRSLDDKIDGLIATYIDNLVQNPFLPGYLLAELHHEPERVAQFLAAVSGGAPGAALAPSFAVLGQQIKERVDAGTMRPITPQQFAVNLISLCIFPFAARPMLSIVMGMDNAAFTRFMEQRRWELPAFFRSALRP
ncbi:MAG TPA: helix-turn-helix domain-containing protein [Gemmatimonadaceae bacterium]